LLHLTLKKVTLRTTFNKKRMRKKHNPPPIAGKLRPVRRPSVGGAAETGGAIGAAGAAGELELRGFTPRREHSIIIITY